MSALLLDATVWLAALDPEDAFHREAAQLIEGGLERGPQLAALDITLYEVASVAASRWGSPRDAARLVELVLAACPETVVTADRDLLAEAAEVAAEQGIPVARAAHLVCAQRNGWALVSTDVAGGHAARSAA